MASIILSAGDARQISPGSGSLSGGQWYWIVFLCAALMAGPAYNTFLQYDFSHTPDCMSYFQMAQGNFNVTITHKYRIVVPLLARAVNVPLDLIYGIVWPHRNFADARLRFSFFVVNLALMSATGLVLFRICQAYGVSTLAAAVAVTGVLSSRWANYAAAIPMVDSFNWLCVALVFLAIKTDNQPLLALAIFLGPLSKESFIFIAPATFLFGRLRWSVQYGLYGLAGLVVLAIHYIIDLDYPVTGVGSLQNAVNHFGNIMMSLQRIFSVAGLGENIFLLGFFNVFWIVPVLRRHGQKIWQSLDAPLLFLLGSAVFQALISTSIARMLCVAGPFWVILLGKGFEQFRECVSGIGSPDAPQADSVVLGGKFRVADAAKSEQPDLVPVQGDISHAE